MAESMDFSLFSCFLSQRISNGNILKRQKNGWSITPVNFRCLNCLFVLDGNITDCTKKDDGYTFYRNTLDYAGFRDVFSGARRI